MPRSPRLTSKDAWYHVMNRGHSRRHLFLSDKHKSMFLNYLDLTVERFGIQVHAFCLMGNHYHLLVHTPEDNLSTAIQFLNGSYAKEFNRLRNRDGFVFKGRFKSIMIDTPKYLANVWRYIHLNPIEGKLCERPYDYPWSSYSSYLEYSEFSWLETEHLKNLIGDVQAYTDLGVPSQISDFYSKQYLPNRLG